MSYISIFGPWTVDLDALSLGRACNLYPTPRNFEINLHPSKPLYKRNQSDILHHHSIPSSHLSSFLFLLYPCTFHICLIFASDDCLRDMIDIHLNFPNCSASNGLNKFFKHSYIGTYTMDIYFILIWSEVIIHNFLNFIVFNILKN